MTNTRLPFHESFECELILAEGYLLQSDSFSDTVVREVVELTSVEERLSRLLTTSEQIEALEKTGLKTVHPKPVITETGLAFICDKVVGNPLDKEIENGNQDATRAYGTTLLRLTDYYLDNLKDPSKPVLKDIVAPSQFTWQNHEVMLHDINTVEQADYKKVSVALNSCQIGYEYVKHQDLIDVKTSDSIIEGLNQITNSLENEPFLISKYINFLNLTVSIYSKSQKRAFKALMSSFEAEIFDN